MAIAYHYCPLNAFFEIVSTKQFWLGNAFFMNDSKEIKWFLELSQNIIASHYPDPEKLPKVHARSLRKLRYKFEKFEITNIYFGSFSQKQDDLNQWRSYAANGHGVAIGCDLEAIVQANCDTTGMCKGTIEVSYSNEKAEDRIQTIINDALLPTLTFNTKSASPLTEKLWEHMQKDDDGIDTIGETFAGFAYLSIMANSVAFKHPSFDSEAELRLLALDHTSLIGATEHNSTLHQPPGPTITPHFRISSGKLIPYLSINFPHDAIKEIWLGPCFDPQDAKAISLFTNRHGIDAKIEHSSVSYRT